MVVVGGGGVTIKKVELLYVFLELPVINERFFPLRHKLAFKLLRELNHFSFS